MSAASDGYIDLRSDTVTRPTPEMRRAMADAEVGDDWYGDDPTVNRLQEAAAGLTGHEAALYLPTGTLCNQIALHTYVRSGGFVACEATAHVGGTEAASAAALSGIAFRRIPAPRGLLSAEQVAAVLEPDPYDVEHVGLVAVENTHQRGGGSVMPVADLAAIAKVCASRRHPPLPGRRPHLQRGRGGRDGRGRVHPARGRADVLPVQGAGGADRVVAGRES